MSRKSRSPSAPAPLPVSPIPAPAGQAQPTAQRRPDGPAGTVPRGPGGTDRAGGVRGPLPTAATPTLLAGGALLILALAFAYANSFRGTYVFDDRFAITDNPSLAHLGNLARVFSPPNTATTGGRPLLNLAFALNYAAGGTAVGGYHAVNLVIHALAALLLFGIVRRTLQGPRLQAVFGRDALPVALVAALLWGLHPVQTESVTYISQRAESLMGLCYLATLYAFIRSVERRSAGWAAASVAACLLGAGVKEVIATAPLLVLLYDCAFVAGSPGTALRRRPWYYPALALTWVALAVLMARSHLESARGVGFSEGMGAGTYALIEGKVLLKYLGLSVWPHPLVFDYGRDCFLPAGPALLPFGLVVLAILGAAVLAWRRGLAPVGFLGIAFFLILAPTSSIVPIALQPMAESRMYLPLAAVVVLVAATAYARIGRPALAVLAAVALLFAGMTVSRNRVYASAEGVWRDALTKSPVSSRGWYNLGREIGLDPARRDEAIAAYRRSIAIRDDFAEPHNNLAVKLVTDPAFHAEAMEHYRTAIRLKPDYSDAHNNLGVALAGMPGHLPEAIAEFKEAIRIAPDYVESYNNLGTAYTDLGGHLDEAVAALGTAVRLRPNYPEALRNLARALSRRGDTGEALADLRRAVGLRPDFPDAWADIARLETAAGHPREAAEALAHASGAAGGNGQAEFDLGRMMAQSGDAAGAVIHLEAAVRAAPSSAEARNGLGSILAQMGRLGEATAQFAEAVRLRPDDPVGHKNLANALMATGHPGEAVPEYEAALRLNPGFAAEIGTNLTIARQRAAAGPATAAGR